MNPILPLTTPQAITDKMFTDMGFFIGTSTLNQRQIAYGIAEYQVALQLHTYISQTIFTGTFPFVNPNLVIESPVGMIISIPAVVMVERWNNGIERRISGTSYLVDPYNGYFMVDTSIYDNSICQNCGSYGQGIYKAEAVIQAGYPTGTAGLPNVQLALCMAADIALKFIYDEGALPAGDDYVRTLQIGRFIQSVSERYTFETPFGRSNKAQYIRTLLDGLSIRRAGKLGR